MQTAFCVLLLENTSRMQQLFVSSFQDFGDKEYMALGLFTTI